MTHSIFYPPRFFTAILFLLLQAMPLCAAGTKSDIPSDKVSKLIPLCTRNFNNNKSIEYANRILDIAHQNKNVTQELTALTLINKHYYTCHYPDSMRLVIKRIRDLSINSVELSHFYFHNYYWLCRHFILARNYDIATKEIALFQEEATTSNSTSGIGLGYKLMGDILYIQRKHKVALSLFKKGYVFLKEKGSIDEQAVLALSIGKYFYLQKQFKEALKWLKLVPPNITEKNVLLDTYSHIALCEMVYGNHKEGDRWFAKVEDIRKNYSTISWAMNNYYLAKAFKHLDHKEYKKAIYYTSLVTDPVSRTSYLSAIYANMGDFEKAYNYDQECILLQDSLNEKPIMNMLISNQSIFEDNIIKSQKRELKSKADAMKSQSTRNYLHSLFALLLVLIICTSIYIVMHQRSRRRLVKAKLMAETAQHRAEQADMLKSAFLANMSHEIRTPLNAIVGFNEILNGEDDADISPEERTTFVELINTNTELLLTLANDILDLSKLESGTYNIVYSDADVNNLCAAAVASNQHRVLTGVKLIFISTSENLTLHTDAQRLQQVITNFITNAIKYTTKGTIVLTYNVTPDSIAFSVTDTGTGISEEDSKKIFNRFTKLDDFKQGTGLGLNICSHIAKLLKSRIYLDPDYHDGARFVFEHPRNL